MFQKCFSKCYVQNYTKFLFTKQCTILSGSNTTTPLLRPIIKCNYSQAFNKTQISSKYSFLHSSFNTCKYGFRHRQINGYLLLIKRYFYTKPSRWSPMKAELLTGKFRKKSELKRLLLLAKREKWYLIISIGCLVISSSVAMCVPYAIGRILDIIYTEAFSKEKLKQFCVALFGIFIIGSLANFGRIYFMNSASLRIVKDLRSKLYRKMLNQDLGWYDTKGTGELINRLSNDANLVGNSLSQNLSDGLRSIITIIAGTSMMVYTSPQLALFSLCVVPALGGMAIVFGRYVKNITKKLLDKLAEVMRIGEERLNNVKTVKIFCKEHYENGIYTKELEKALALGYKDILARASFYGLAGFSGNVILISVLYYGGALVSNHDLTVGALTSFIFYAGYAAISMTGLTKFYTELNKGVGAAARIWEIFDRQTSIPVEGGIVPSALPKGDIIFKDLTFCFPTRPKTPILRNINMRIAPGQITAIVGRSGCGKSTVGTLIMRLYDPQSGCILLDGVDIKDLNPSWLRNNIGAVNQEPVLFSGSIRENILYGLKSGEEEHAEKYFQKAVEQSYVDDFVKTLPEGYETLVGQRGMMLSGGQKQRVAIARALIRNPAILILDEATSALDSMSESLIQKSLENVSQGRTVLTIAHRLSTIRHAQNIIVLGNSTILEQGTYEELIDKRNGVFRDLVKQQTFEATPLSHDHNHNGK